MFKQLKYLLSHKEAVSTQTLVVIILAILAVVIFGGYVYTQVEFFRGLFLTT